MIVPIFIPIFPFSTVTFPLSINPFVTVTFSCPIRFIPLLYSVLSILFIIPIFLTSSSLNFWLKLVSKIFKVESIFFNVLSEIFSFSKVIEVEVKFLSILSLSNKVLIIS